MSDDAPATPGGETAELPAAPTPRAGEGGWRARVLRGLKRHEEEREDAPPPAAPTAPEAASLGRYRLLRELGRGGMGAVHEAEDTLLGRRVALKLLRADRESPQLLERFQIEARAAARLQHPNLVALFEVGEDAGRRFLVMELIEGRSLAARLQAEGPLEPREAARIAERVADALAYAHSRAILHRDVKPANVLLDAEGQARLTDFGLAKEVERAGVGPTDTGQAMGTPAYMAPEMVRGELERVDRRADVYALGVTLFEALTGRVPFEAPTVPALLKAILDQEPPPPGRLRPGLDRDLETICLRCLEKEPEARYGSAGELAEDLRRWLRHEPIAARRPGPGERAGKWLRRNRGVARALAGSSAVALLVIVSGTVAFLMRLRDERDRAAAAAHEAEVSAREARRALDLLVREVKEQLGDVPGERVRAARERLLRQAADQLQALQERDSGGGLRPEVVEAWSQIRELGLEAGDTARASEAAGKALAAARRLVAEGPTRILNLRALMAALHGQAEMCLRRGEPAQALAPTTEALEVARRIAHEVPAEALVTEQLAICLQRQGEVLRELERRAEARASYEESLQLLRGLAARGELSGEGLALGVSLDALGSLLLEDGQADEGRARFEEAVRLLREQLARAPGSAGLQRNLAAALVKVGHTLLARGDRAGGQAAAEEALAIRRALCAQDPGSLHARRGLASSLVEVGNLAESRGDLAGALGEFQEAVELLRGMVAVDPADGNSERALGIALRRVGAILRWQGDRAGARRLFEEAVALQRGNLERSGGAPGEAEYDLASALFDLSKALGELNDAAGARTQAEEGLAVMRRCAARAPDDATLAVELGRCLNDTGMARAAAGAPPAEVEPLYREALELLRARVAADPEQIKGRRYLAHALILLGELARPPEAGEPLFAEAEQVQRAVLELDPGSREDQRNLVISLQRLGDLDKERGEHARAVARYEEMVRLCRGIAAQDASSAQARRDLRFALEALGDGLRRQGDVARSSEAYREGAALIEPGAAQVPARELFKALTTAGEAAFERADLETAIAKYEEAVEVARLRLAALPQEANTRRDLSVVLLRLADAYRNDGRTEDGVRTLEEAAEVHRPLAEQLADRYAAEHTTFLKLVAEARRELALVEGQAAPATPEEALELAGILVDRGDVARAVEHFAAGLQEEALRADLESRNLYRAASAASRAAAAAQDPTARQTLLERGLAWLGEDLRRRRALLAEAERAPAGAERDARVNELRAGLEKRLRLARTDDEDLAALRAAPGFAALVQ